MSASPTPFRPALTASLLTAAAGGAITVAALSAAPAGVRPELGAAAACGVLLLCAAAFAVTWYARTARALNRRAGALSGELTSRDAALASRGGPEGGDRSVSTSASSGKYLVSGFPVREPRTISSPSRC
ncbi:hypothetical protein ACWD6S_39020, partial [Streptomyces zhihengii]